MKQIKLVSALAVATTLLAASWHAQAVVLDLTTTGTSGIINGAVYTQNASQSTGTGVLDTFVQVGGANMDQVHGYNTTVNSILDNASSDQQNHEITVGEIGFVDLGDGPVMRFILDINQTGVSPLLNLDEVQIFISTDPNQSVTTFTGGLVDFANAALVYQMDAGADSTVNLDFSLNSGSGSGDMFLDISASAYDAAFTSLGLSTTGDKNNAYIYLYSAFGTDPNNNNDGFEEWGALKGNPIGEQPCVPTPENNFCGQQEIPEPGVLPLVAVALLGAVAAARKRRPHIE